jgi:hypothetical protein
MLVFLVYEKKFYTESAIDIKLLDYWYARALSCESLNIHQVCQVPNKYNEHTYGPPCRTSRE